MLFVIGHSTMMKHLEPLQDATRIILLKMFLLVQVLYTSAAVHNEDVEQVIIQANDTDIIVAVERSAGTVGSNCTRYLPTHP